MKKIWILFFVLTGTLSMAQNQINMGQYMIHQPFVNPAAIASYNKLTFAGFYRSQWMKFEGAPVTQGFNAIIPLKKYKHTLSLTGTHDAIGINRNSEVSLGYAYSFKVGLNAYLSFGVSASLDLLQADYTLLHTIDQNDPLFQTQTPLVPLPDFKFGTYFFKNRFYAGFTVPNLLNNKIIYTSSGVSTGNSKFDVKDLHYYFHMGYSFLLNEKFDLNVSTLVKEVSGAPIQFDINTQLMYKKVFGFGLSYRTSKEALGILSLQIIPSLKFAYAYEYNLGEIGDYSSGSHEVMLIYQLTPPNETVVSVPRF